MKKTLSSLMFRPASNTHTHANPDGHTDAVPDAARQHAAEPNLLPLRASLWANLAVRSVRRGSTTGE